MPIRVVCIFFSYGQRWIVFAGDKNSGKGKEIVCCDTVTTPSVRPKKSLHRFPNWKPSDYGGTKKRLSRTAQKRDRRTPISVDGHWIYLRLHFPWIACHARGACIWHRFNETPHKCQWNWWNALLCRRTCTCRKKTSQERSPSQYVGAPKPGWKNDACQNEIYSRLLRKQITFSATTRMVQNEAWIRFPRLMSGVFYSLVHRRDSIIIASLSWIQVLLAQQRLCGSFLFEFSAFAFSFF